MPAKNTGEGIRAVSGHSSPAKVVEVVEVDGMDVETLRAAFSREKTGKSGGMGTRE